MTGISRKVGRATGDRKAGMEMTSTMYNIYMQTVSGNQSRGCDYRTQEKAEEAFSVLLKELRHTYAGFLCHLPEVVMLKDGVEVKRESIEES